MLHTFLCTIIDRMKDTAVRELRAYVSVSTAHIAFIEKRAPEVQVRVRNSGKTPAYDVRMWIGIGHGPYPVTGALPPPLIRSVCFPALFISAT
jgi:hypothetical protein